MAFMVRRKSALGRPPRVVLPFSGIGGIKGWAFSHSSSGISHLGSGSVSSGTIDRGMSGVSFSERTAGNGTASREHLTDEYTKNRGFRMGSYPDQRLRV